MFHKPMRILSPVLLTIIFTAGILFFSEYSHKLGISVSSHTYINFQINYQILLLIIAGISMICSYGLNSASFRSILAFGNISAPADELKLFGIYNGDNWFKTGISLSLVISLVTGTFMYFQLNKVVVNYDLLYSGWLWVILFALTNSFAEEMIFRVGINGPLHNLLSPKHIYLISGIIFGLAHFHGMPNGILGMILAGLLGYILSKSVHETSGIFWAWFIHFLQDVIIIGSLYLINETS